MLRASRKANPKHRRFKMTDTERYFDWKPSDYRTRAQKLDTYGVTAWRLVSLDDSRMYYVLWYDEPIAYVTGEFAHIEMMSDDKLNVTMRIGRDTTWQATLDAIARFIEENI